MAMSKKIGTTILAALLLWGFEAVTPSVTLADPPPWAPAHGHRLAKKNVKYKYIYYPSSQIYYSPVRGGYYYPYSGGWRFSPVVPSGLILGNGVSIQLGGPTPYVYHPTVIQQYPMVIVR